MNSKKDRKISIASAKDRLNPSVKGTNPFVDGAKKICQLKEFRTSLERAKLKDDILNVVSISLPSMEGGESVDNGKEHPFQHLIYKYSAEYKNYLLECFKNNLTYAVEKFDAHVICINELGMPLNKQGVADSKAIEFAKKIANAYNCLIVAGTNHNKSGFTNNGYIFYPGLDNKGRAYQVFYKNVSAFQIEPSELLFTPSRRIIQYTRAFGLGFAFLICLEVADFSSAAAIVSNSSMIDFLMVPAYLNTYGPMEKVAAKISSALGGVLLDNCYKYPDYPKSRLYLNGIDHSETGDRVEESIASRTTIILRKVNITEFRNAKSENELKLSDELKYLFDSKYRRI